jgi:glycosyltransferase involved in cell wall biosynthesis
MNVLFLAPQPFFIERGTPIAVKLALETLSRMPEIRHIDLFTYGEGETIPFDKVTYHRTPQWKVLSGIRAGISLKKLIADIFMFIAATLLILKRLSSKGLIIHAVEESVFFALFCKIFFRIPYIYDMDSHLTSQLVDKWRLCKPLLPLLMLLERSAIAQATLVLPVCRSLGEKATASGATEVTLLHDISLLDTYTETPPTSLREELNLDSTTSMMLYVGNLEHYQGIDLLIESFAVAYKHIADTVLVIIGGPENLVSTYRTKANELAVSSRIYFLGSRPITHLGAYLREATLVTSPRILGDNTPMKVYSYLHSGTPLLATNLHTHTQVLTSEISYLAQPSSHAFAEGMIALIKDVTLRATIGAAGKKYAEAHHSRASYNETLTQVYRLVQQKINQAQ